MIVVAKLVTSNSSCKCKCEISTFRLIYRNRKKKFAKEKIRKRKDREICAA